jgi:sulfur carrier protein
MAMKETIMTITLNGGPHELAGPLPLTTLLDSLGLAGKPVVVELNEVAVLPGAYPTTLVTAGARIEIVTLAAGG